MHGKTLLPVARAAHPPPALCVQWAVELCWGFHVGLSKEVLDLEARVLAPAITPAVRSIPGEGSLSLQHSYLAQIEHLILTLISSA